MVLLMPIAVLAAIGAVAVLIGGSLLLIGIMPSGPASAADFRRESEHRRRHHVG